MSEASGRAEMERRLVQKALRDDAFRQRLLEDPRSVVEETADTVYLALPLRWTEAQEAGELSDRELEEVAGRWMEADAAHSQAFPTESCGC